MLIIGLGNLDRGDDAAGILVARRLFERGIEAFQHRGSILDLLDMWETATCTVIVDAVLSGAAPGTVHMWDVPSKELRETIFRSSTHAFGLVDAIELARTLNRLPPKLTIYGIEGAQFVVGAPPSVEVIAGVERAIEQIVSRLAQKA
jgi:hydrogenase maturation protease